MSENSLTNKNCDTAESARRVYLESPYSGEIEANTNYAIQCMQDCLLRGEAPFVSHLLYTQEPNVGFVSDYDPKYQTITREAGIDAAQSFRLVSDCTVVYMDRGMSSGMEAGIAHAKQIGQKVEFRRLAKSTQTKPNQ